MLHGFSRTTLSALIIVCLLLISWIHLGWKDEEQQPLPALQQPPLATADWQFWQSIEGVGVYLRSAGDVHGGYLALRSASEMHVLSLPANDWTQPLKQQLPGHVLGQAVILLVSGPWDELSQKTMAAYVIRSLQLHTLHAASTPLSACVIQHLPGALWLTQQQTTDTGASVLNALLSLNTEAVSTPLPDRKTWSEWRLEQTRMLRQNWQNDRRQIDIQADLAYYRPPEDLYRQLYNQLGQSQKTAPAELLQCLSAAQPQREPSQH
ncbi:MAG: hypothetical protein LRY66_09240 [Saccharospirillaceae bacterium]|nr:hypothetical protein [Saccharospirillaceae bacterium]MCD8531527.1 hypothetical protein [Saccharospirillaceae bacterium]